VTFTFSTLWPALGASGALLTLALGYAMMRSKAAEYLDAADLILLKEERRREAARRLSPVQRLADRFVPRLRRLIGAGGVAYLQRQIDYAGRPVGVSVDGLLRKICWWLVVLVPVGVLFVVRGQLIGLALIPLVAILLPLMRIAALGRHRRESIDRDLPDFLERFEGPISSEVRLTLDQLAHGASIRVAFSNMERRCGSQAMRSFVTALLQAEELGAPLAVTLNQIATDMRRENAQALRRKAAKTAPRVTLVTSLVLVPAALILVIVGLILGANIDLAGLLDAFS
jgi:tight adherence protein C